MRIFSIFIAIITLCSCDSSSKNIQKIKWDNRSKASFTSLVDNIKVCQLESNSHSLIGTDPILICSDSSFYIVDKMATKTIKKFDKNGKYITTIGKIGRASGEYENMRTVVIDSDSDDVFINNGLNTFYVYSKDGKYKECIKKDFPAGDFIKYNGGFLIFIGYNNGYSDEQLLKTDSDFNVKNKYLPIKTEAINFKDNNNFSLFNKSVYMKESFVNTIYRINADQIQSYCSFDFQEYNVDKKYFQTDDPFTAFMDLNNKGFATVYNYMKNKETEFVEVNMQTKNGSNRIFGIKKKDKWTWVNTNLYTDSNMFKGVFQKLSSEKKILGLILPADLLKLYKKSPNLFSQKKLINSIKEEDNPLVITAILK